MYLCIFILRICARRRRSLNEAFLVKIGNTVNSPNNGHFGARPTVRYSGCVLYWGVIVGAGYGMEVPCQYRL